MHKDFLINFTIFYKVIFLPNNNNNNTIEPTIRLPTLRREYIGEGAHTFL